MFFSGLIIVPSMFKDMLLGTLFVFCFWKIINLDLFTDVRNLTSKLLYPLNIVTYGYL